MNYRTISHNLFNHYILISSTIYFFYERRAFLFFKQDRGEAEIAMFEVGPVFLGDEPDQQRTAMAAIRHGAMAPREWHGSRRSIDVFDAKADAEAALAVLGVRRGSLQIETGGPDYFHPGRCGRLLQGRSLLAQFGELHPQVAAHFGLRNTLVAGTDHDRVAVDRHGGAEEVPRETVSGRQLRQLGVVTRAEDVDRAVITICALVVV